MRQAVTIPRDDVERTLGVMTHLAVEGSRTGPVRRYVEGHARELARVTRRRVEAHEVFRAAYAQLVRTWTYVEDPYGEERVASPEESIATLAGDCDDAAALVAGVARASGLRASLEALASDGEAYHVRAAVQEREGGAWLPLDLAEGAPYAAAFDPPGVEVLRVPVDPPDPGQGVGFLPAVIGGVAALAGVAGSIIGSEGGKDAARTQARGQEAAARIQAAAIEEQADAQRDAARSAALASVRGAEAAERIAATEATTQRRGQLVTAESVARTLAFLRDVWPVGALLLLVRFTAPVIEAAVARRAPTRRKRAAPRKAAA